MSLTLPAPECRSLWLPPAPWPTCSHRQRAAWAGLPGSMLLYIHRDHKDCYGWEPRKATPTVTQALSCELLTIIQALSCELLTITQALSCELLTITQAPSSELLTITQALSSELLTITQALSSELLTITQALSSELLTITQALSSELLTITQALSSELLTITQALSSELASSNVALFPKKPLGDWSWGAQDGHLIVHTASELWTINYLLKMWTINYFLQMLLYVHRDHKDYYGMGSPGWIPELSHRPRAVNY